MIRLFGLLALTGPYMVWIHARILFFKIFRYNRCEAYISARINIWARRILRHMNMTFGMKTVFSPPIARPGRFLVVSNHQSLLDILILLAAFRSDSLRFIAKKELAKFVPAVSTTLRTQKHALISRKGDQRNMVTTIKKIAKRCAQNGLCPVLYPEGTRSRDGRLGEFHPAGFRMIQSVEPIPVILVAMDGLWKLSTIKKFTDSKGSTVKVKMLHVYDAPQGKAEEIALLEDAKARIQTQLDLWRSAETENHT